MRTCSEVECQKNVIARGLCSKHYDRAKKEGTLSQHSKRASQADKPCKLDGCEKPGYTLGYCQTHYDAQYRYGDPIGPAERRRMAGPQICSVDHCAAPVKAKGLCGRHYENLRSRGRVAAMHERPLELRLIETGWDVTETGCWEWAGARNDANYGLIPFKDQHVKAHRVMYESRRGPLAEGLIVRHHCDNPPCVNPDHLSPGTHRDNMMDMSERGRAATQYENTGWTCPNGHDMTGPGAYKMVNSRGKIPYRTCVTCARTRGREYARRKRAERAGA